MCKQAAVLKEKWPGSGGLVHGPGADRCQDGQEVFAHFSHFRLLFGHVLFHEEFCDVIPLASGALVNWRTQEVLRVWRWGRPVVSKSLMRCDPTWLAAVWVAFFSLLLLLLLSRFSRVRLCATP